MVSRGSCRACRRRRSDYQEIRGGGQCPIRPGDDTARCAIGTGGRGHRIHWGSQRPTRHPVTALKSRTTLALLFLGISAGRSCRNPLRSAIVLSSFGISGEPMQNVQPTDLAPAAEYLSPVSSAINRVIAIAPAPLLPGEKQADYADVAAGIVRAAQPRDAIEEFLVRDVVDLTWEILRLRRIKAGILRASMCSGVRAVLAYVGHKYPREGKARGQLDRGGRCSARQSRRHSQQGRTDDR